MKGLSCHNEMLSFHAAMQLERNGKRLVSNKLAGKILSEGIMLGMPSRFWTRTIIAYPSANNAFSYEIRSINRPYIYILDTRDFRGEKNIAIVFDEYDLIRQGRFMIYQPKEMEVARIFPQENGWYSVNSMGIPIIGPGTSHFLWRWNSERVGPIVRGAGTERSPSNTDIYMHHRHSEKFYPVLAGKEEPELQKGHLLHLPAAVRN